MYINIDNILYLMIYSFLGWVLETIYCSILENKFVNRGFLNGPFCPIYGFGALIILTFLHKVDSIVFLVFIFGMIITSVFEYFTSYILEKAFNSKWWDYSSKRFNINGRVCLFNSVLFGLLCVFVYYDIHIKILNFVNMFSSEFKLVFVIIFLLYVTVDFILSCLTALEIKKRFQLFSDNKEKLFEKYKSLETKLKDKKINEEIQNILSDKKKNIKFFEKRLLLAFPNMKNVKSQEYINSIKKEFKLKYEKKLKKRRLEKINKKEKKKIENENV